MKKFEIEMDIHFTKTLHIEATNEDAATMLAETMLLCTDALPLTDADMIGLITTATELEKKPASKPAPSAASATRKRNPARKRTEKSASTNSWRNWRMLWKILRTLCPPW